MDGFRIITVLLVLGVVVVSVVLQVAARRRAGRLVGQPLPALPGETGAQLSRETRALVYFFTPSCAVCRALTPRMLALAEQGRPVFPVDATRDPELARALSVLATPTTLEVADGRVVQVFIGPVPDEVYARFAQ